MRRWRMRLRAHERGVMVPHFRMRQYWRDVRDEIGLNTIEVDIVRM